MFIFGWERRILSAKVVKIRVMVSRVSLGLVVTAAYRPLVLRTPLILYVLNANSGR